LGLVRDGYQPVPNTDSIAVWVDIIDIDLEKTMDLTAGDKQRHNGQTRGTGPTVGSQ